MAPFFIGLFSSETANCWSPDMRTIWQPTVNGDEAGLSRIAQACVLTFDTLRGG